MTIARRTALKLFASTAALSMIGCSPLATSVLTRTTRHGQTNIDWASFLGRHDMMWDHLPVAWDEAPFLGNGLLGSLLFFDKAAQALRFDIYRTDVQDHRTPIRQTGVGRGRLPIGHFLLRTRGRLTGETALRLGLNDATLTGHVMTDQGRVDLKTFVHAEDLAIVMETTGQGGEAGVVWEWIGEEAISPRITWAIQMNDERARDDTYVNNPPGVRTTDGGDELWLQPLLAGGGTATAWRQEAGRLITSVAHDWPGDGARSQVLTALRAAVAAPPAAFERSHQAWWRDYYPASFLSIPNSRLESFYWIQMYKLACATRADRPYIDNQGPWVQLSTWPYATWNLNVQLNYWAMTTSNRNHLAMSLVRAIHDNQSTLINNVNAEFRHDSAMIARSAGRDLEAGYGPPKPDGKTGRGRRENDWPPEVGNLTWAMHDVWLVWRHTMDETILRETLFPVLRRSINYYRHFLTAGEDGKLHLPPTYSPEYGAAADANYDLALLKWGCIALIDASDRLKIDDPLRPEWVRIRDNLVDYPQDPNQGYLIGREVPLDASHRHYSHLLMIYPLYLVNRDQPGAEAVIDHSVTHWLSMPASLRGYSSTGSSSMYSALGRGDRALTQLQSLFTNYLRPNTMYKEGGPVIETPLSGAQSIHDMLLQSWGGVIRPFPAVPSAWTDASFANLSAEGGFLVSARREAGRTLWIEVTSRAGEPFALQSDISDPVATIAGVPRDLTKVAGGRVTCALGQGETIFIHARGPAPPKVITPERGDVFNSFGLNARSLNMPERDLRLYQG